jgi:cellulose synthase/poly-beta-1,6-N-acetylglucosamine synthase-like glycosyltransferase
MMMGGLVLVLVLLVNLLLVPYFLFLLFVSIAALLPRRTRKQPSAPASSFLVVIPAHDEEPVISKVVQSCLEVDYPRSQFEVLVVADNCSDRTAEVAQTAGARVVERLDLLRKSKGHAIDYIIDRLERTGELDGVDALVFVDADTTVDPDLLAVFDQELQSGHDWIQAYYTVSNPDESWRTRLLNYAFSLYNGVLPWGKFRLGLGALFKGNGMCLSVRGLRRIPWHCHGLVEDMEYAWILRIAGEQVVLQPDVAVQGAMLADGGEAAANQRRRWEYGRKEVRRKFLSPLIRSKRLSVWKKILAFCDLTMPAMGVFLLIYAALFTIDLLYLLGSISPPSPLLRAFLFAFVGLSTCSIGLYSVSPFFAMRLPWRFALSVSAFPLYLFWKLGILLGGRPDRWVRTPRQSLADSAPRFAEKAQ